MAQRGLQRGFTLLELMLVVGVIGILAGVALPAYEQYTGRAKVAEAFGLAVAVQGTIGHYYDRWGVLPRNNAAAGLPPPNALRGTWVSSIEVTDGVIQVQFIEQLSNSIKDRRVLQMRPAINTANPTGALIWTCNRHAPPPGHTLPAAAASASLLPDAYVPATCR